jgi:hypothetical protein
MTSVKCSKTTATGEPCKCWAIRDTDPPICSSHAGRNVGAGAPLKNQNARTHGFYSRSYSTEEVGDLINFAFDDSLEDELAATRIAVRRVLSKLHSDMEPKDYANLARLVLLGTRTIGRLLKDQRLLTGATTEGIAGVISQALDELNEEFDVSL